MSVVARFVAFNILLGLIVLQSARAETIEPNDLNEQVLKLYRQGEYVKAAKIAKRVLVMAEKKFGLDHPNVGVSLYNLAALYKPLGSPGEAQLLLERARAIFEKAILGSDPGEGLPFRLVDASRPEQAHVNKDLPLPERKPVISKAMPDRHHLKIAAGPQRTDKSLVRPEALVQRKRVAAETSEKSSRIVAAAAPAIFSKQIPGQAAKIRLPPLPVRGADKRKKMERKSKRISRRLRSDLNRPSAVHRPQPVFTARPSVRSR